MSRPQIVTGDDDTVVVTLQDAPGQLADTTGWTSAKAAIVKSDRSAVLAGPYDAALNLGARTASFALPGADTAAFTDRLCVIEVQVTLADGKKRSFVNGPAVEIVKGLIP